MILHFLTNMLVILKIAGTTGFFFFSMFRYSSCCWITLANGQDPSWEVRVKGNLTRRADNGLINTSPISTMAPVVRLQYGCNHMLQIPGNAELTAGTYSTDCTMKITLLLF